MLNKVSKMIVVAMLGLSANFALAEETVGEKMKEAGRDTKKSIKKGYRSAKDKACEMVNGKLECAGDKIKHGAQNIKDEVDDKVDDIKK